MSAYFSAFKEHLPRTILVGIFLVFFITIVGSIFGFFNFTTVNNKPLSSYKAGDITFSIDPNTSPQLFGGKDFRDVAEATTAGKVSRIQEMVGYGLSLNPPKAVDISPLYWALGKNNLDGFSYLLENGANPNVVKSTTYSIMHQTVASQRLDFLKAALKHGGNPDQRDIDNLSLLFLGLAGDWYIFKTIVDNGANVNIWQDDKPLVFSAIEKGQFKKAWLLLENGADHLFADRPDLSLKMALEQQLLNQDLFSEWQNKYLPYLLDWFDENGIIIEE